MKVMLSALFPFLVVGQDYSSSYPQPTVVSPTPYTTSYQVASPPTSYSASYSTVATTSIPYVPPTPVYAPAKLKPRPGKATPKLYIPPVYTSPTPRPATYVSPTPPYAPPTTDYSSSGGYSNSYSLVASSSYSQAYPLPARVLQPSVSTGQYVNSYQIPPQRPPQYTPTPAPTIYRLQPNSRLMCTESSVGCFQGHIRLCVPGQRQDNAAIVRRCEKGCMKCPSGVPDACVSDKYAQDICTTLAAARRAGRTCSRELEGKVGCMGGPDIGYCSAGQVIIVDYCGSAGCVGNPSVDQCWPLFNTPPPTALATLPPLDPDSMCVGNYMFCWQGHIRLCLDKQPKDAAAIIQDCRSQGCSSCATGPDICNDPTGVSVCPQVPTDRQITTCPAMRQLTTYCDGFDVRHCDSSLKGILVEYCGTRGCTDQPAACNVVVNNDQQRCNGTYVTCLQGHIRLCRDGEPMAQAQVLHNCRAQGCSDCPNAPSICNDENRRSMCGAVPATAFAQPCDAGVPPMTTTCAGGADVRHCDPSGRAFLVEYCAGRGCQSNPLGCSPPPPPVGGTPPPPPVGTSPTPQPPVGGRVCGARVRREWGTLPDADRTLFINGLQELYRRGDCAQLAQFHYNNKDRIHGTDNMHFLIWHRVILFEIEEKLRSIPGYECVTIPYWNYQYSNDTQARQDRRSPFGQSPTKLGQGDSAGCIGGVFSFYQHSLDSPSPHCIRRNPTDLQYSLGCALFMDLANIGEPTFPVFANNLQVAHGSPHISFGDTFSTHYSPIDPLFWIHHANIDRTWDLWQDCHADYWWYEPGALSQPIIGYPGVVAGDFIDNANVKWQGRTASVSYSSDDFQDPSAYSSDFRRNVITRCRDGGFRRYTTPNPVLGVDDAWTKSQSIAQGPVFPTMQFLSSIMREKTNFLQCVSPGLDQNHGPILVTYSGVTVTECASKCDKFFFKNTGDSNCMCTSTSKPEKKKVVLSTQSSVSRTAYSNACPGDQNGYGFYDLSTVPKGRRLLQTASSSALSQIRRPSAAINRLSSPATNSLLLSALGDRPFRITPSLTIPPAIAPPQQQQPSVQQPSANDLCFDQQTSSKPKAPESCAPGSPKFILPQAWLEMNKLSLDSADPCQKYTKPVGFRGVQCVNVDA